MHADDKYWVREISVYNPLALYLKYLNGMFVYPSPDFSKVEIATGFIDGTSYKTPLWMREVYKITESGPAKISILEIATVIAGTYEVT